MRTIFFICLIFSPITYAGSWLEKIKDGYSQVDQIINQSSEPAPIAKAKPFPTNVPSHWQFSYFNEPVFNSEIVVLESGKKNKQSIILVHGLGQLAMQDWYNVIPALEKQYHVIALDLPGFGYSGIPEGRYSPTHYGAVVKAVVNQFAKNKVIVIGHSMGGAVSLRFSAMSPELVSKLILVDAAGILQKTAFIKHSGKLPIDESIVPEAAKKTLAQINDFGGAIIEKTSSNVISDTINDVLFKDNDVARAFLLSDSPNVNAAMSLVEEDFSEAIYNLNIPTAIIWGKLDAVAPVRTGEMLFHTLKTASLNIIEDAGHVPMASHTKEFLSILTHAIESEITARKSVVRKVGKKHLICDNKANQTYTGTYASIVINGCANIRLNDISTQQLTIKDSLVEINNLTVLSNDVAINADESVISITNGTIIGKKAIVLEGSRLDLAGTKIKAIQTGITSGTNSQLVFSISELDSPKYQGFVHGTYTLDEQTIEQHLTQKDYQ